VAVHDVVEQTVHQVADALRREVRAGVPALDDLADVKAVVLADGDQRARQDEGGELAGGELAGRPVEPRAVGGEEQVRAVAVDLRPFPVHEGVLDRHRVQPELLLQDRQVTVVRVAQVEPDQGPVVFQVIADPLDREALIDELAVPVEPRACLAPRRGVMADAVGGDRLGVVAMKGGVPQRAAAELAAKRPAADVGFSHEIPLVLVPDQGSHPRRAGRAQTRRVTELSLPRTVSRDCAGRQ
jgi:hypothetical protein